MSVYKNLLLLLPEVKSPVQKGTLKKKLICTFVMLVLFLFLASVHLYGVASTQAEYF